MPLNVTEDIRSITDLKRDTVTILNQVHSTGRPLILTVNGRAQAVLLDAKEYDKLSSAFSLLQKLLPAEEDVKTGRTRSAKAFFKEFRGEKKL